MKKLVALMMTLVMMLAVAVPAFATKTITTEKSDTSNITVNGTSTSLENYTVTIPAQIDMTWGKKATATYTVACQLTSGRHLQVVAAPAGESKLNDTKGNFLLYSLAHTSPDTSLTTISSSETVTTPENHSIEISVSNWNSVPLGTYEGTMSFTVSIVQG